MVVAFILLLAQLSQGPVVVQGLDYEISVPNGWKAQDVGNINRLEHVTGSTLLITRSRRPEQYQTDTHRTAERLANPLGFATIGEPRHFRDSKQEWFEYDIRGNRLANHRRILYRAIRNEDGWTEIIFESPENRYDALVSEALSIASSLKSIPRKVRVRK